MPRYYFNLEGDNHADNDRSGTLLSNDSAARNYAERIVGEFPKTPVVTTARASPWW